MALWDHPDHQCAGCIYNMSTYGAECNDCRRKANTEFNTSMENPRYLGLPDKYTAVVVVSCGSTKVLKRRSTM